ncbi:cation:proton antiporter [Paragemmobacter ruber]|uniref:Cyclic nucleotide-binding domain-containing protein n=1 Tax=Paragemmobacter ruber TaxID=1985673 RepID=A0ABW9Y7B6_9RHOB|nr:cation:proton antiporter [Rhodobacter ruber]NBE08475.1 cyclic nucleotide-binding domain-containing protein [Rhodobacter ruber]
MDLIVIIAILTGLFLAIALAEPLGARLRLPTAVILAALGIAIGAGAAWFWRTDVTDALNPVALAILTLPISSDVFIYVLLPILLFQVSLSLNLRRLMDDWVPVLTLAVVAVLVATVVIAFALQPFSGLPLLACLLLGAIVSTTDPSAVVSIFRATPAPQRLARIVEGESLLNDAAAIALFSVFLAAIESGDGAPPPQAVLLQLPWMIFSGAIVGAALGRVAVAAMGAMNSFPLAQFSVSFALPFATFLVTDQLLGGSGVVSAVAAGMTVNFLAPGRMAPPSLILLRDGWNLLAYWAGGLIFVLAALLVPEALAQARWSDLVLVGVVVIAAFVARAVMLWGLLPLLTWARLSPRVEGPYRIAILWGGLRGAVTLALALAVTENPGIPFEVKRQVGIVATGFVLFTLLVQGTTLRMLITWLGLDRLSPLDRALSEQVVAVALQDVRETVADTVRQLDLTPAIVREEAVRFGDRLNDAVERADEATDLQDKDRVTLGMVAMAGHERDLVLAAFRDGLISARVAERMLTDADRLIEATRVAGRSGYRAQARRALARGQLLELAERAYTRYRLKAGLQNLIADRFELLVSHQQGLRGLRRFVERRILRIHGRRVASLLQDLLRWRIEETGRELEGLRIQFPGYAEEVERRLIRRLVLRQEELEYDQYVQDGLIGPELKMALQQGIDDERARLAERPLLDLRMQRLDIVRSFHLFSGLDEATQAQLARRLKTVYAKPGDVLVRREDLPDRVWFVASGAVEAELADGRHLLGHGEMFGHLSVLQKRPRRATVRAITHTTLVTLSETAFRDLMRQAPQLAEAVEKSAERRGMSVELSAGSRQAANPPPPWVATLKEALRLRA